MNREEYKAGLRRLKAAGQRTVEIYRHVGCLSTNFAGLEMTLLQLVAKMINPSEPLRAEKALSRLSFRQTIDTFRTLVAEFMSQPDIVKKGNGLCDRLEKVAKSRNDIIHSSWIAYTKGDFGQHQARSKRKNKSENQIHVKSPIALINQLTDDIGELIFDLDGFEENIK